VSSDARRSASFALIPQDLSIILLFFLFWLPQYFRSGCLQQVQAQSYQPSTPGHGQQAAVLHFIFTCLSQDWCKQQPIDTLKEFSRQDTCLTTLIVAQERSDARPFTAETVMLTV
jgi:hypothetical protein